MASSTGQASENSTHPSLTRALGERVGLALADVAKAVELWAPPPAPPPESEDTHTQHARTRANSNDATNTLRLAPSDPPPGATRSRRDRESRVPRARLDPRHAAAPSIDRSAAQSMARSMAIDGAIDRSIDRSRTRARAHAGAIDRPTDRSIDRSRAPAPPHLGIVVVGEVVGVLVRVAVALAVPRAEALALSDVPVRARDEVPHPDELDDEREEAQHARVDAERAEPVEDAHLITQCNAM